MTEDEGGGWGRRQWLVVAGSAVRVNRKEREEQEVAQESASESQSQSSGFFRDCFFINLFIG